MEEEEGVEQKLRSQQTAVGFGTQRLCNSLGALTDTAGDKVVLFRLFVKITVLFACRHTQQAISVSGSSVFIFASDNASHLCCSLDVNSSHRSRLSNIQTQASANSKVPVV